MFLVIDGSSILTTNYYGTLPQKILYSKDIDEQKKYYPDILQTSDGIYTNAIIGTLRTILTIIQERPDINKMAIVFDKSRNTFRKQIYPLYKANRKDTPEPLKEQFITMENILQQIGLKVLVDDDFEADDIAGTLTHHFASPLCPMVVMTKDHDYLQLINKNTKGWIVQTNEDKAQIIMYQQRTNPNGWLPPKVALFDATTVLMEEGVLPHQIIDKKAICGDPSDNIPGVYGVGPSSATPLISHYGSIEELYEAIEGLTEPQIKILNKSWKENLKINRSPYKKLIQEKQSAFLSKELATIRTDAPIPYDINKYNIHIDKHQLENVFQRYELNSLQKLFS